MRATNQNYSRFETRQRLFLTAYRRNMGNVSKAAKAAGVPRRTFYNWRVNDAAFAEECRMIDEAHLDLAESKLLGLIEQGNERAIIFYLKNKGQSRGYSFA